MIFIEFLFGGGDVVGGFWWVGFCFVLKLVVCLRIFVGWRFVFCWVVVDVFFYFWRKVV